MEEFDGIVRGSYQDEDERPSEGMMSPRNYASAARDRRKWQLIAAAAVSVVVLAGVFSVSAGRGRSSEKNPATGLGSGASGSSDTPAEPSAQGVTGSLLSVTPRQRVPGTYADVIDMKIHEDMSDFGDPSFSSTDIEMEMDFDSIVDEPNPDTGLQLYTLQINRFFLSMDLGMMGKINCDTDMSIGTANDPRGTCDELIDLVGEKQGFIINTEKGTVIKTSDVSDAVSLGRLVDNPIDDNGRIIQLLPAETVAIGDTWDFAVDMGQDIGHYTGSATFAGIVSCDEDDPSSSKCARIQTEGDLEMDLNAAVKALGVGVDNTGGLDDMVSDASLSDVKMNVDFHWDDVGGYTRYSNSEVNFILKISIMGQSATIPVKEEVVKRTTRRE